LSAEAQKKLIPLFFYSLSPGGVLFLGSAETVGSYTDLFMPIAASRGFSGGRRPTDERSRSNIPHRLPRSAQRAGDRPGPTPPVSLQTLADQMVLQRYAPPAVLTNEQGDIF